MYTETFGSINFFFFLKLTKRRQKIIMDLHQEGGPVLRWLPCSSSFSGWFVSSVHPWHPQCCSIQPPHVLRGPGQEVGLTKCVLSRCLCPPLSTPHSVLARVLGPRIGFLWFSPFCLWQLRKTSFLLFQILNALFALVFSFSLGSGSSCDTPRNGS